VHCHLDCYSGVSGDMLLGAIVDAGVPVEDIERPLKSLGVTGWRLRRASKRDPRIGGTKVDVSLSRGHDSHHRRLPDIVTILKGADKLPEVVRARAIEVFEVLAEAEAEVHGIDKGEVHFHEVGATDAIVDIAGTVLGLHLLGVDSLSCGPLPLGSGMVKCAHGLIPVPAPATAVLLRGLPTVPGEGKHPTGELVTPTGAALVRVLCRRFGPAPSMRLDRVAYGLGGRDRGPIPNALRLLLGTAVDAEAQAIDVISATIDDMDSRLFGPLAERLFADGAVDVTLRPAYGKKGRPLIEVVVLGPPDREVRKRLQQRIFTETTTLGLRWRREERTTLERRFTTVESEYGPIAVKHGLLDGEVITSQPEFDSCVAAADAHGVPVRRVVEAALVLAVGDDRAVVRTVEPHLDGPTE
jgi:pyridinium-3,5-bisthiocarboxylic acid mononucleotide nickel chelatase